MKRNIAIITGLLLLPALSFSQVFNQVGADIDGEAAGDASGKSVSISADGTIVAIGAKQNGGGAGHTRVFEFSAGSWNQLGTDIDGSGSAWSGQSVSLSDDGKTVAIGAPVGSSFFGLVQVFSYNGSDWIQVGSDLTGAANFDNFGSL